MPRSGKAFNGAPSGSTSAVGGAAEDVRLPMSDFAPGQAAFSSSAKDMAMKAAGWIGVGLQWLFGPRARGRTGILTYHRVSPMIPGVPPPTQNVTPDRFRGHMAGLLDRGFTIWPLGKMLGYHVLGRPMPPRTIALTFDDGFQSVHAEALAVLREFHVPATVFLATAYLGSRKPFPFDTWGLNYCEALPPAAFRPLTVEQCRELVDSGLIDLGAHTHTHRDLRGRPECFREDLQTSVDFLRTTFGLSNVMFAFPYGGVHLGFADPDLVAAAKLTGVNCGLTTECALIEEGSDPFQWGRFHVFPWDTVATLDAKLDGWYTWAARGKRATMRRFLIRQRS